MNAARADRPDSVTCPFTVTVDSRERRPYSFLGLRAGFVRDNPHVVVPTMKIALSTGDYGIFGYPQIAIERKSPEDLYASVGRRSNFVGRLERMSELAYAAVVVEEEFSDLIRFPPPFTKLHPRSLSRTLIAWDQRYAVRWWYVRGREAAEKLTFRILERFYVDHIKCEMDRSSVTP